MAHALNAGVDIMDQTVNLVWEGQEFHSAICMAPVTMGSMGMVVVNVMLMLNIEDWEDGKVSRAMRASTKTFGVINVVFVLIYKWWYATTTQILSLKINAPLVAPQILVMLQLVFVNKY